MPRVMPEDKQLEMWEALGEVQGSFPNNIEGFLLFVQLCINSLIPGKPDLNRVQADICKWLFNGPQFRMIQAQRGQSKTVLTAIYAVFKIIHDPKRIILIISAGGKMSKDIASFIIQIIDGLDILWMLRADKNNGDRSSVEGYDVHWALKGVNKSPSIKCMGVDSNLQGSRADTLISDDCESMKNSRSVMTRELLEDLTREFESICSSGEIIYLGTPQTTESIYNNLPGRGYAVRIWTGRYPTYEQEDNYAKMLAPMLIEDMVKDPSLRSGGGLDGLQGKPTCPEMFDEEKLLGKELSMGAAKFQLQFMLNTRLTDEERYPLKLRNLIVAEYNHVQGPVLPVHSTNAVNLYQSPSVNGKYKLYRCMPHEYEIRPFEQTVMYIDPAGSGKNGADETGYAVIKIIGTFIYIYAIGGVKGGFEKEKLLKVISVAKSSKSNIVLVEKNFGHGAYMNMIKPLFEAQDWPVTLEEVYETGQKELRIIDVVEPILTSHRLIISPDVIEMDYKSVQAYPTEVRTTYRLLHQIALITREKGSLRHDDRLDALAGAIRYVVEKLDFDTKLVIEARRRQEQIAGINQWKDPKTRRRWLENVCIAGASGGEQRNKFNTQVPRRKRRNKFS